MSMAVCTIIFLLTFLCHSNNAENFCLPIHTLNSKSAQVQRNDIESLTDSFLHTLMRGYVELDDGWIAPFNGYKYKLTPNQQNWKNSQTICKSWGGDLAVHGVRDYRTKLSISQAFVGHNANIWIGLSDEANEGNWFWVNGNRASTHEFAWGINERGVSDPVGGKNQNCGAMHFIRNHTNQFRMWEVSCSSVQIRGLCENSVANE